MLTRQHQKRASAGGGRVTLAIRLTLLLILALATVEYIFGFTQDASPYRTYLYNKFYNDTQSSLRNAERTPASLENIFTNMTMNLIGNNHTVSTVTRKPIDLDKRRKQHVEDIYSYELNDTTTTSVLITKILVDRLKNGSEVKSDSAPVTLPMCEAMSDLGPIPVNKSYMELNDVDKKFPDVQWGGWYTPPNCTAKHKVAIIVPYRDRQLHLAIFLNHMHPFLMKQQIEYGIYIVEQNGTKPFNHGKLTNVGFVESQKLEPGGFQCFIFHDIDVLPLDTRHLYSCKRQPRHMFGTSDRYRFKLPYYGRTFGGVTAMTFEQILSVNGFSNKYWGWGGEDDDMFFRVLDKHYRIARNKISIARYADVTHQQRQLPNPNRYQLLREREKRFGWDGLSTLRYEIIQVMQYHLYTHILADIDEPIETYKNNYFAKLFFGDNR